MPQEKETVNPRALCLAIVLAVGLLVVGMGRLPLELLPVNAAEIPELRAIADRQARAWSASDVDAILADFAEDAQFVVPGQVVQGKAKIRNFVSQHFADYTPIEVTIRRVIGQGAQAAIEWQWQEQHRPTGDRSQADDVIIFQVKNGKIVYWREYIDTQSPPA